MTNLSNSTKVISFIKPLSEDGGIDSLEAMKEVIKDVGNNKPPFTLLTSDFFKAALNSLPQYEILRQADWVEIGVWKGGGGLFFKALMEDLQINKNLHLIDTFDNFPVSILNKKNDLNFIDQWNISDKEKFFERNYEVEVRKLFESFQLDKNVFFVSNDIMKLPLSKIPKSISFLHLDVDFYEPTYAALDLVYDNILPGGIIIIDDYYTDVFNCKDAVNDFFKLKKIDLSLHSEKFSSFSIQIIKP